MHGTPRAEPIFFFSFFIFSYSLFLCFGHCCVFSVPVTMMDHMPTDVAFSRPPGSDPFPDSPQFNVSPNGSCSSDSPSRTRQSRILDRWATNQVRGIITSMERQAHEAEISALTTNVRAASSLIQMWRGLEADSGTGTPTTARAGEGAWEAEEGERHFVEQTVGGGGNQRKVRCVEKEVAEKMAKQQEDELKLLAGSCAVSQFSHKRRIQTLPRFRSLRREADGQEQRHRGTTTAQELDQFQRGVPILTLKERFSSGNLHDASSSATEPIQMQYSDYSIDSEGSNPLTRNNTGSYEELTAATQPEEHPPHSESEDSREDPSHSGVEDLHEESDTVWEEEVSLEMSAIDWERPVESSSSLDGSFLSRPTWEIRRQAMYKDLLETYSDNVELRELLMRRTVSNRLNGAFRDTLEQLISSALQRQGSIDGCSELDEDDAYQGHNLGFETESTNPAESPSFSLAPISFQGSPHSVAVEPNYSSHDVHQRDIVQELKSDIARMNQEMRMLRQLFQSCMEKQEKFQYSVQREVTDVLHSLVAKGESRTSKREPARKGNCCICYESKIDSLLYRCGHMCTCLACGRELQWNSGRCPVCRAPITDVVRAYLHA